MTFLERAEQWGVIKLCVDIVKILIETNNFLNQSEKHCDTSHSFLLKWHRGFWDRKDSLKDNILEERPYFRDSSTVKITFMTLLTVKGD
jgi:hypothetical protein